MLPVMTSAYMITRPSAFLAARPMVWINAVSLRRKPSLSASNITTSRTSGKSSPSRSRLMPTSTSNSPFLSPVMMSIRSSVSISLCIYRTRTPFSLRYSVKLSAIFFVSVVMSTLPFFAVSLWISTKTSSICPFVGRTSTVGSSRPVGRISCSTTCPARSSS